MLYWLEGGRLVFDTNIRTIGTLCTKKQKSLIELIIVKFSHPWSYLDHRSDLCVWI